jgi:transposase
MACVSKRPPASKPELLSTRDEVDDLSDATTPEQIERIVSAWTRRAEHEADKMLAPVQALADRGDTAAALAAMRSILVEQSLELQRVRMRDRLSRRLRFGKSSEKLDADELAQAYLAFAGGDGPDGAAPAQVNVPTPDEKATEVDAETVAELGLDAGSSSDGAEASASAAPDAQLPAEKTKRPGGGRRPLADTLRRIENLIRVPDAERPCVLCGRERKCVGHRRCVRLEYVPGHVEAHEEVREVLACPPCRKDMSVAPREELKRKVRAAPSLMAEFLILKCDDALPLHRVREQLIRLGLDVPKSTLGRWWDYVTTLLGPLADVIIGRLLADEYLGVDDTGLLYLEPTEKGKKRPGKKGHLWCFVGQEPLVGFRFTRSWDADEIATHLVLAEGFVQGDAYAGYGAEVEVGGERRKLVHDDRRLGCFVHARRPFHELVAAKDVRANHALLLFQSIYKLEAEYRERGLDHAARGRERLARSLPLFDKLAAWIHQIEPRLRPKDPLAKAITYFINQEPFLRTCLTDGRFELDTSRVERAIREVAIGRKNFVLSGSPAGAERLATAYTVIESARRALGTDRLRPYLIDVISKLERGHPLADLNDLIPTAWAASQSAQQAATEPGPVVADSSCP